MAIPTKLIRYLPTILGLILTAVVIFFAVSFLSDTGEDEPVRKKVERQVTIIATPPPPPPPPPKVEEPPEPEVKEEIDIPEPEQDVPDIPDAPPMGDDLGLDADGSAGSDAFGMIGRKGGRSLLDGDPRAQYAGKLQRLIEDLLVDNEEIRVKAYSIVAQLWLGVGGNVEDVKLSPSTGDKDIDEALVRLLKNMAVVDQDMPEGMPRPIKLRISSRM